MSLTAGHCLHTVLIAAVLDVVITIAAVETCSKKLPVFQFTIYEIVTEIIAEIRYLAYKRESRAVSSEYHLAHI